VNKQKNKQPD